MIDLISKYGINEQLLQVYEWSNRTNELIVRMS